MKRTVEQIREAMAPLYNELHKAEEVERLKKHANLVGKCFKFRNGYSSDEKWWLYAKVTNAGEYWPRGFAFEITARGEIEIKPKYDAVSIQDGGSWQEITLAEFNREWRRVRELLAKLKP